MPLSSYSRDELLDALLGNGSYNSAGTYVSLHTANPGLTGASESADSNYARVQATFGAASGGVASNTGALVFASGVGWNGSDTLTHAGIFTAASSGNFLIGGSLDATVNVNAGNEVEFAIGALDVTLT